VTGSDDHSHEETAYNVHKEVGMKPLIGKVALVTGASRGVGKGIALGLGEAGATVYITGRTVEEGKAAVVAQEYGFRDIDGKQPRPITVAEA